MIDWKDTILLTFNSQSYNSSGVKIAVPKSFIKTLKQVTEKSYSSTPTNPDPIVTRVGIHVEDIKKLNINVSMNIYDTIHEFTVEEDFKIVLGMLQDSPGAKILYGQ